MHGRLRVKSSACTSMSRVLAGLWLSIAPLMGLPGEWHADFGAAVREATASGKDNLLLFTGLGWEEWSRKLRDESLAEPGTSRSLREDFVLTHIDLPETPGDDAALGQVEAGACRLARDFRLHVFPSIYLCTPEGRPYALVGYEEGGPEALVRRLRKERAAFAETMRSIDALEGPECARALDAWLQTIPEPLRPLHRDKINRIIAADPRDEAGLRTKHQLALMIPEARELRYAGDLDDSEALYQRIIEEVAPAGEDLQRIYYEMGDIHFQRRDYDRLLAVIDLAIEAAPDGERMSVLREMTDTFTRQWIFTRFKPDEMRAAEYEIGKIALAPDDYPALLALIGQAKRIAPESRRNRVLDAMAKELAAELAGGD